MRVLCLEKCNRDNYRRFLRFPATTMVKCRIAGNNGVDENLVEKFQVPGIGSGLFYLSSAYRNILFRCKYAATYVRYVTHTRNLRHYLTMQLGSLLEPKPSYVFPIVFNYQDPSLGITLDGNRARKVGEIDRSVS